MAEEYTAEQYEQELADLVEFERTIRWRLGDIIQRGAGNFGPMNAYRMAAGVLGKSVRWALELAKVAETFPEEERHPDADWYLYRVSYTYSEDPVGTIRGALERGLSPKDLKQELDTSSAAPPPTHIKGEFVLDYTATDIRLTPAGALDVIELGDGMEGVPVKATIKSFKKKGADHGSD